MSGALLQASQTAAGLALRASLLIAAAWLAAGALRNASAAKRSLAWFLCMAGLLMLPVLYALLPAFDLPMLPDAVGSMAAVHSPALASPGDALEAAPVSWSALALGAYLLGAGVLLLRVVAARDGLARLWRKSAPADDPAWLSLVEDLTAELRLSRRVQLKIAELPIMPMTWGSLAPKVLLPSEARSWSMERRRHVLLHELAHVIRFDSLGRSVSSIACALYWFHPWAWLAARQLRLEQELAADNLVLGVGEPAETYASSLLELARELGSVRHPLAAAMAGKWQLERRIIAMAAPASRAGPGAFGLCVVALVATLASALLEPARFSIESEAPVRTPTPTFAPSETHATSRPARAGLEPRRAPPAGVAVPAHSSGYSMNAAPDVATSAAPTGSPPQEELTATRQAPPQKPPVQALQPASYGPRLEPAAPDYRWRLKEDPSQSPDAETSRPDPARDPRQTAATAAREARARPAGSDDGRSDKGQRMPRLSLQIIPTPRARAHLEPAPPPNGAATILPWLGGAKL